MALLNESGIKASFHYVPLHSAPHARTIGAFRAPLPITDSISDRLLRLPLHPLMTEAEVERVIEQVRRTGYPR